MSQPLLDMLYIKRFCLPCDTNITDHANQNNKVSFNNYNHIAITFTHGKIIANEDGLFLSKTSANILSFGVNSYGDMEGKFPGTHAELDSINKLPNYKNKNGKQVKQINIFVTRISKIAKIQNSKPCNNCIKKMKFLSEQKGYKIKHVFYTDNNCNIIQTDLKQLENEPQHYSLFYRSRMVY